VCQMHACMHACMHASFWVDFIGSSTTHTCIHAGILVPLYILVLGFSPKRAIPLSNVTILVSACAVLRSRASQSTNQPISRVIVN